MVLLAAWAVPDSQSCRRCHVACCSGAMWRLTSPPTLASPGDAVALARVVRGAPEAYLEHA
eukprot:4773391-Alexandrium_andersonii.AAC.1